MSPRSPSQPRLRSICLALVAGLTLALTACLGTDVGNPSGEFDAVGDAGNQDTGIGDMGSDMLADFGFPDAAADTGQDAAADAIGDVAADVGDQGDVEADGGDIGDGGDGGDGGDIGDVGDTGDTGDVGDAEGFDGGDGGDVDPDADVTFDVTSDGSDI